MATHQEYVDSIKKSAVAAGKKLLIAELTKRVPWLFIPVIGPLVSLVLGKVIEILVNETEFAIFFNYIDMRTDSQGREFSKAALVNLAAQRTGSPQEKAQAERDLIVKFKTFAVIGS